MASMPSSISFESSILMLTILFFSCCMIVVPMMALFDARHAHILANFVGQNIADFIVPGNG